MTELHLDASRIAGPDACRKILLVGESNPLCTSSDYALYHEPHNCAGHRLQSKILGVRARQTYLPMWRTNLCVGGWDFAMACDRAQTLFDDQAPWDVVVMLGKKVALAFSKAIYDVVQPFGASQRARPGSERSTTFVSLPHPSGRNAGSWTPANVARARATLTGVAPLIPWGETDRP